MEITQLRYFKVVAETQNITAAAEKLFISQPTLSKVIKRLEEDLGVKLFDRRASRLILNQYGGSYLVYANQALDALDRGRKCLENMQTGEIGGIRLASTFMGLPTLLTEQFVHQHSSLSVIESSEAPDNISTLLLNNHADFALTLFPLDHPNIQQITSIREPLLLVLPTSMAEPGEEIMLSDYESCRFAIFEGGKDMNSCILRSCSEANFVPNIVYRSTHSETVFQLIEELKVCALIPAHMVLRNWEQLTPTQQKRVCLVDEPKCYRNICLSVNRYGGAMARENEAFLEFAVKFLQQIDSDICIKLKKIHSLLP